MEKKRFLKTLARVDIILIERVRLTTIGDTICSMNIVVGEKEK